MGMVLIWHTVAPCTVLVLWYSTGNCSGEFNIAIYSHFFPFFLSFGMQWFGVVAILVC